MDPSGSRTVIYHSARRCWKGCFTFQSPVKPPWIITLSPSETIVPSDICQFVATEFRLCMHFSHGPMTCKIRYVMEPSRTQSLGRDSACLCVYGHLLPVYVCEHIFMYVCVSVFSSTFLLWLFKLVSDFQVHWIYWKALLKKKAGKIMLRTLTGEITSSRLRI